MRTRTAPRHTVTALQTLLIIIGVVAAVMLLISAGVLLNRKHLVPIFTGGTTAVVAQHRQCVCSEDKASEFTPIATAVPHTTPTREPAMTEKIARASSEVVSPRAQPNCTARRQKIAIITALARSKFNELSKPDVYERFMVQTLDLFAHYAKRWGYASNFTCAITCIQDMHTTSSMKTCFLITGKQAQLRW